MDPKLQHYNIFQVPHLLGDPSKGVSYGKLDDISELDAELDYKQGRYPLRDYNRNEQADQDRSAAEVRLHEAIEEVYGDDPAPHFLEEDPRFNELLMDAFPEKDSDWGALPETANPKNTALPIIAAPTLYQLSLPEFQPVKVIEPVEEDVPKEETILSFEKAKELIGPYTKSHQGNVSIEAFEHSYRALIELGSNDLEKSHSKEQRAIASDRKKNKPDFLQAMQAKLSTITSEIDDGTEQGEQLSGALEATPFDVNDVRNLSKSLGSVNDAAKEIEAKRGPSLSHHLANIFFFLKDQAPAEMADGRVFEDIVKPLLEEIARRTADVDDLKKPKKPDPAKIKSRNTWRQKNNTFKKRNTAFPAKVEASIPEIYKFILERLGEAGSELISQRLEDLG